MENKLKITIVTGLVAIVSGVLMGEN